MSQIQGGGDIPREFLWFWASLPKKNAPKGQKTLHAASSLVFENRIIKVNQLLRPCGEEDGAGAGAAPWVSNIPVIVAARAAPAREAAPMTDDNPF